MHSHILSLDKKSWTRSFESRPNLFRVERKHRPNCGLEFHFWFWIFCFFLPLFLPTVQNGATWCRLPLCMSMFGFWAMACQRPMTKANDKGQATFLWIPSARPPPPVSSPPQTPRTPPVGGSSMTRGRPLPGPQAACTFLSFRFVFSVRFSTFL